MMRLTLMDIKYYGHATFQIKTKGVSVLIDPYAPDSTGLKLPKVEADIVLMSHDHSDHSGASNVAGNPLVFNTPGEFESREVRMQGYPTFHDNSEGSERGKNILFKIEAEGISVLHCGDLGHLLKDATVEDIDRVDVLMIPVGGHYTIDAKQAAKVVHQIEPAVVIPMHYKEEGLSTELASTLAPVTDFLAEFDIREVEPVKKLTLKASDIGEDMKVIVMERS